MGEFIEFQKPKEASSRRIGHIIKGKDDFDQYLLGDQNYDIIDISSISDKVPIISIVG